VFVIGLILRVVDDAVVYAVLLMMGGMRGWRSVAGFRPGDWVVVAGLMMGFALVVWDYG
jgi:hypothetical protein